MWKCDVATRACTVFRALSITVLLFFIFEDFNLYVAVLYSFIMLPGFFPFFSFVFPHTSFFSSPPPHLHFPFFLPLYPSTSLSILLSSLQFNHNIAPQRGGVEIQTTLNCHGNPCHMFAVTHHTQQPETWDAETAGSVLSVHACIHTVT